MVRNKVSRMEEREGEVGTDQEAAEEAEGEEEVQDKRTIRMAEVSSQYFVYRQFSS